MRFERPLLKIALLLLWLSVLFFAPRLWAFATASLAVFHIVKCQICAVNIARTFSRRQRKMTDEGTKTI
jgi:hypothetical protein